MRKEVPVRTKPADHPTTAMADRLAKRGQFHRAMEQYEKVLQLHPHHGKAAVKIAWLLVSCDDEALRDHDRPLRLAARAFDHGPAFFPAPARAR